MESVEKESAVTYSQTSSFQRGVGKKLISKLPTAKGAKILDLGCGTGETTTDLSELVGPEGKIIAVDPDAERIKLAKEKNARANIEYSVGDDTNFPKDQYDLVFMNCVIHWVADKLALFKCVYENIRPGGSFAFSTGIPEVLPLTRELFSAIFPTFNFFEDVLWKKALTVNIDVYKEMLKSTAFILHDSETMRMYVHCENTEACLDWYFGLLQGDINISLVDQKALQAFKKEHDEDIRNNPMPFDMYFAVYQKP